MTRLTDRDRDLRVDRKGVMLPTRYSGQSSDTKYRSSSCSGGCPNKELYALRLVVLVVTNLHDVNQTT